MWARMIYRGLRTATAESQVSAVSIKKGYAAFNSSADSLF